MLWQCAGACRGEGRQLMCFAMASLASLFPCALSSSTVSSYVVNFAGKGLPPSCVFIWCLIPCKPDFIPKPSFPSWHFNRYKEVCSVIKGVQGSKSLTFWGNWLLNYPSESLFFVFPLTGSLGWEFLLSPSLKPVSLRDSGSGLLVLQPLGFISIWEEF